MISGDLKGKNHRVHRHFINGMYFLARNDNQAVNSCVQMLTGSSTFLGIWSGGGKKRIIRSGVAAATVGELLGKLPSPAGPLVPLDPADGRPQRFFQHTNLCAAFRTAF